MKIARGVEKKVTSIKVRILKITDNYVECRHEASGVSIRVIGIDKEDVELGQIIEVEYKNTATGGGYILKDLLMENIQAKVLKAQHIIADNTMYTSLILENAKTQKRMHSLVPNTNKLFSDTSIIITGDTVTLKINNGMLFSILT